MKLLFTCTLLLSGIAAFAQTSLTVFNNGGQSFFVIMNGIRQNSLPQTNVRIDGLALGSYEMKLIFADGKTNDINKKFWFDEPGSYLTRVTFKDKVAKLKYFGVTDQLPAGGTPIRYRPNDQSVYSDQVVVTTTSNTTNTNTTNQTNGQVVYQNGNQQTTNGQTTMGTNITITDPAMGGTGGIQMNTTVIDPSHPNGQYGMGTNITIIDPTMTNGNGGVTTTTTTTTTTTHNSQTTTTTNGQVNPYPPTGTNGQVVYTNPNNQPNPNNNPPRPNGNYQPNTTTYACSRMLTDVDGIVRDIKDENFDTDKRQLIETELANYCLTADQAYRIINTLTFNADRFDMCKFLYDRLTDKVNGKRLLELLTFDMDKEAFKKYMRANP